MATYDPAILQKFADKMYLRAASMIVTWAAFGLVLGAVAGAVLYGAVRNAMQDLSIGFEMWEFVCAIGGLVLGVVIGIEKAFWLKLEAQKVLCALQTEINTRPQASEQPKA